VGGPVNHFIAQTLIDATATQVPSSPYACQGHPIRVVDQLSRDGRCPGALLGQDIPVVIKIGNSIEELTREVGMLRRVQGEGSPAPEILDAAFGPSGDHTW
jgi:hypothetical protein